MKTTRTFLILFLFPLLLKAQEIPKNVTATWTLSNENPETILLSEKMLSAILKNKVTAYDQSWKPLTPKQILSWVATAQASEHLETELTLEECAIALACGDVSVLTSVKTTLPLSTFMRMNKDQSNVIRNSSKVEPTLSYRTKPEDFNGFYMMIIETIQLDTSKIEQRGEFLYLQFQLDSTHNFRIKYEDFLKLKLKEETEAIQSRQFYASIDKNLMLQYNGTTVSLRAYCKEGQEDFSALNQTVFKYFKQSIHLYNKEHRRVKW